MTQYLKNEMRRLLFKLPETDPRSPEYHTLLQSIECLGGVGSFVDDLDIDVGEPTNMAQLSILTNADTDTDTDPEDETAPAEEESRNAASPTLEEVRAVAATARLKGVDIAALINAYNVRVISDVPKAKLSELLDTLNEKIAEIDGEKN